MTQSSPFVPGEVSVWTLPLRIVLQEVQMISPLCAPGALQISISPLPASGVFVCLFPLLAVQYSQCQQNLLTFKPSDFKPRWLHKLAAPLIFKLTFLGGTFSMCVYPCTPLSLTLLCNQGPSPLLHTWSIFLPSHMSTLTIFFDVDFSLALAVEFVLSSGWCLRYSEWIDSYLVVFEECSESRVLLLHYHLPPVSIWVHS